MLRSILILACCLLVSTAALAPAISRADFERVVDFSVTLKTLAAVAEGQAPLPSGKLLMLDGTVADVNILEKEQETFRVRIELISGEWFGLEEVKSYTCYADFSGPEFFKIFPAKAPRNPAPNMVMLNSRVVLIARPLQVIKTPLGENRVLVEGLFIRTVR